MSEPSNAKSRSETRTSALSFGSQTAPEPGGGPPDAPVDPHTTDDAVPLTPRLLFAGILAVLVGVTLGLLMSAVSLGK